MLKHFEIKTKGSNDIIDITSEIEKAVAEAKIKQGICLISSPSSTSGITTIEHEPELLKDFKEFLEKIIPSDKEYRHDKVWGEKNGFSHIRSTFIKPFLVVPIEEGKLVLGTWQQIIFIDFDNRPRTREIFISLVYNYN